MFRKTFVRFIVQSRPINTHHFFSTRFWAQIDWFENSRTVFFNQFYQPSKGHSRVSIGLTLPAKSMETLIVISSRTESLIDLQKKKIFQTGFWRGHIQLYFGIFSIFLTIFLGHSTQFWTWSFSAFFFSCSTLGVPLAENFFIVCFIENLKLRGAQTSPSFF